MMYIHQTLINALSAHMIHINLKAILISRADNYATRPVSVNTTQLLLFFHFLQYFIFNLESSLSVTISGIRLRKTSSKN